MVYERYIRFSIDFILISLSAITILWFIKKEPRIIFKLDCIGLSVNDFSEFLFLAIVGKACNNGIIYFYVS